jgi:excisionase family DNA binding protein
LIEVNVMSQLLTVKEAADALGLKTATIRAWLLRRKLPRVNCGRCVRVPADAIAKFIELNTVPAKEKP